jgi:hypothetical protein
MKLQFDTTIVGPLHSRGGRRCLLEQCLDNAARNSDGVTTRAVAVVSDEQVTVVQSRCRVSLTASIFPNHFLFVLFTTIILLRELSDGNYKGT